MNTGMYPAENALAQIEPGAEVPNLKQGPAIVIDGIDRIGQHSVASGIGPGDRALAKIAKAMLSGLPHKLTGGATYYHTTAVRPNWSRVFAHTTTIGVHKFYREDTRLSQK